MYVRNLLLALGRSRFVLCSLPTLDCGQFNQRSSWRQHCSVKNGSDHFKLCTPRSQLAYFKVSGNLTYSTEYTSYKGVFSDYTTEKGGCINQGYQAFAHQRTKPEKHQLATRWQRIAARNKRYLDKKWKQLLFSCLVLRKSWSLKK